MALVMSRSTGARPVTPVQRFVKFLPVLQFHRFTICLHAFNDWKNADWPLSFDTSLSVVNKVKINWARQIAWIVGAMWGRIYFMA